MIQKAMIQYKPVPRDVGTLLKLVVLMCIVAEHIFRHPWAPEVG